MPTSFSMPTSIKELPVLALTSFFVPLDCTNVIETLEDISKSLTMKHDLRIRH